MYVLVFHKGAFKNYVDKKGGGGSAKSPRLSTQGGGRVPLNVHVDKNLAISESSSYYCALEWVVKQK